VDGIDSAMTIDSARRVQSLYVPVSDGVRLAIDVWLPVERIARGEVIAFGATNGSSYFFPQVGPHQLHGIELNEYAHELAQMVIWIGYIQWLHDNGFGIPEDPILKPLEAIEQRDAILGRDTEGRSVEPDWPEADVVIGNPPFLGGGKIRQSLGDDYVAHLFRLYQGRIPAFSDLVCYWFERTRAYIEQGKVQRAGLLATQGIRGGANRTVLERIKQTGDIFWAWSDRDWILNGASVHVSMVGFDDGSHPDRILNGRELTTINADLTPGADLTAVNILAENQYISFQGPSPKAPFDVDNEVARQMLSAPINVNGRSNDDIVRPVASAIDLVQRSRGKWTIDFGLLPLEEACKYEFPFEYVKKHVYPIRSNNRRASYAERWWQYAEARPGMRVALGGKTRYIATPRVSKHRIFVWLPPNVLANDGTIVFAREDDYFFGVLQSKPHELWARGTGTQLREVESGFRYTPTSTFETFPLPWPPGSEPAGEQRVEAIASTAAELVAMRDRWLNPNGATEVELKARTLTNLYNQFPTWLQHAHEKLDAAVFDAYGWPQGLSDEQVARVIGRCAVVIVSYWRCYTSALPHSRIGA